MDGSAIFNGWLSKIDNPTEDGRTISFRLCLLQYDPILLGATRGIISSNSSPRMNLFDKSKRKGREKYVAGPLEKRHHSFPTPGRNLADPRGLEMMKRNSVSQVESRSQSSVSGSALPFSEVSSILPLFVIDRFSKMSDRSPRFVVDNCLRGRKPLSRYYDPHRGRLHPIATIFKLPIKPSWLTSPPLSAIRPSTGSPTRFSSIRTCRFETGTGESCVSTDLLVD